MRKSKYTAEQIAYCLTQSQAGVPIAELRREYGISQQTFYRWRARYGDLSPSEVKELQQVREEICAQFWSRDPGFAPPNNIGLTNGSRFTICA